MNDKLSEEQTKAILKILDEAIEQGPWEQTNFLRVIGKNLREIRQDFANYAGSQDKTKLQADANQAQAATLKLGHQEVFVGLYSTEGNNIHAWERILTNLPRHIISRPIYINEQDIINLIKSKTNKVNEAYLVAHINQKDILQLPPDKAPSDRFGRPLLPLKGRVLDTENYIRFVHLSGTYRYVKGQLVKIS